jgi:hypothetical protein
VKLCSVLAIVGTERHVSKFIVSCRLSAVVHSFGLRGDDKSQAGRTVSCLCKARDLLPT